MYIWIAQIKVIIFRSEWKNESTKCAVNMREEMVKMLQNLYYNDRKEFLDSLRYCFEEEKVAYHVTIEPQKVNSDD